MGRSLLTAVLACVVGVLATTGAGGAGEAEDVRPVGFVYLAPLAALHPLYPELARIDEAVRALRADELPPELPVLATGGRINGEYIAGPVVLHWPGDRWLSQRDRALARLASPISQQADELPPDLALRLSWETRRVRQAAADELLEADAEAGRELAKATVELYRDNQERLLDAESSKGAPGETRQSVVDQLEAELTGLQSQHEARIQKLRATLEQRQDAEIRELEHVVWRAADERLRPALGATGRALREAMTEQMGRMTTPAWLSTVQVRLPVPPLADMVSQDFAASRAISLSRREQRDRQAEALIQRRAQVTQAILDAVALAAERLARRQGLRLYTVPGHEPVGPDMTQSIAEGLERMWVGVREPRSQEE